MKSLALASALVGLGFFAVSAQGLHIFKNSTLQLVFTKTLTVYITSVARVLQYGGGGGFENDITFDHTLYRSGSIKIWWGTCRAG